MKKFILSFVLLTVTTLAFATSKNDIIIARATTDNVKMYYQAGTSTEVLMSLKTTDKIIFVRKHNSNWAIVTVGDRVGYVLYSELTNPPVPVPVQTLAMQRRRK